MTAPTDSEQGPILELSHQPRGWSWPRLAVLLGSAAIITIVLGAKAWIGSGLGRTALLVVVSSLITVAGGRPLNVPRAAEASEDFDPHEAFLVFALFVLPPAGVFLVMVIGGALGELVKRRPLAKSAINFSLAVLSTGLAIGFFESSTTSNGPVGRITAAAVVAALIYSLVSRVIVSFSLSAVAGIPARVTMLDGLRFQLLQLAGSVSIGLVAGLGARVAWWAPLLTVLPMVMVYVVLTEHLRARADRERIDGLLHTAMAAHATIETDDVLRALEASARELLKCRRAWVATRPPGPNERGVPLGMRRGSSLWLIVADRIANEFNESDDQFLQGMAAIAGSALDNAELVDRIRHQGLHDQLTSLPNQLLFDDRARQAVQRAQRDRESVAVLAINLDGFKKVNESFGHETGNEALIVVAGRLSGCVREVDTLARMSGDHFNVLVPGISSPDTISIMAERILEWLRRPFRCADQDVFLTGSIGIAIGPAHGLTASELLRNADSALHQAKAEGGDGKRVYSPDMNEQALARLSRESELHAALRNNELFVLYQPQINLRSGAMVGVEALVRWRHPVLGVIPPDDFIPIAEESGLIADLDAWVMRTACEQLHAWDDEGLPPLHMAVNQSGRNFSDDRLIDQVISILERTAIDPGRLEVEITERVALRGTPETLAILERLRRLGVRLAVDDFGTGYSSLAQLQQFTVDRLKIDRAFIRQITSAHGPAPLIAAFIGIARALNMEVIAEGVETAEQEAFLRRYDCDEAQGYLYAKPVPPADVADLLRRHRSLLATSS